MTKPALVIPYGTARPPNTWMTPSPAEGDYLIRIPFVTVAETQDGALRLDDYLGRSQSVLDSDLLGDDQLTKLRRALTRHCDPWQRSQHRFLDCYFDFITRHVENHRNALIGKLESYSTLFQFRDWVYSGLLPLPRAHLHAPNSSKPFGPETLAQVDFAFWTGTTAIAIEIPGKGTRSPVVDQRHLRLRRAGVGIIELEDELLEFANAADFEAALPEDLLLFWHGRALPSGPLKPAALNVEVDEF